MRRGEGKEHFFFWRGRCMPVSNELLNVCDVGRDRQATSFGRQQSRGQGNEIDFLSHLRPGYSTYGSI